MLALGILAGATQAQLISGVAALAAGAVLYAVAPKSDVRLGAESESR